MIAIQSLGKGALRVGLISVLAVLAACVGDQQSGGRDAEVAAYPIGSATFDCGDDGLIMLDGNRDAVTLIETDGSSYNLPASPPSQTHRFGDDGMALVVEDGEALWMKAGKQPMTCRR
ncbi:hypothetical protein [Mesorhizobium sp. CAU 1741]|uniref:hypothetical protein n=1 Tax=Mesorhizobium sp. CAU 1741 TaxID=3140366 RepID=UPI00325ADA02